MEITREKDLEILKQAYDGNHLEKDELLRAKVLCILIKKELEKRTK